ncbi:cytochrome P450 [Mrakia frigida]|uniref:cytochrome P450 n=1 Tax=Mrakia frigida TaxID=29902 RepID=UPI003FCC0970
MLSTSALLNALSENLSVFILALSICLILPLTIRYIYDLTTAYNYLDGPSRNHWFWGNMDWIVGLDQEPGVEYRAVSAIYGPTWRDWGLLGLPKIYTHDLAALNFILKNDSLFTKPEWIKWQLAQLAGENVLSLMEGDVHKTMRRLFAPSFAVPEIKAWTPMFLRKSYMLHDVLRNLIGSNPHQEIDMSKQIGRCTLDIVSLAIFDHDINSLASQEGAESSAAFSELLAGNIQQLSVVDVVQNNFPMFRSVSTERVRRGKLALGALKDIAREIISKKKAEFLAGKVSSPDEKIHAKEIPLPRDLLSRVLRANLADDLPDSQRLSDEIVLETVTGFIFAGLETTTTALSHAIHLLSTDLEIQDKLRKEILAVEDDFPSLDDLNNIPYFDAVIREALRLRPAVPTTFRSPKNDVILPLSTPVKNIKTGELISEIQVRKGEMMVIPVRVVSTANEIWGDDSLIFNPDRWLQPLPSSADELAILGWSHQLTFIGGPRLCQGYRFALAEMKSILFVLLRNFKFELSSVNDQIVFRQAIVLKPVLKGKEDEGATMPIKVSRV